MQVKRLQRIGRFLSKRGGAHEAGMVWGSGAFKKRCGAASRWFVRAALLAGVGLTIGAGAGRAETIGGALVKAYLTNPDINTQRAAVRVADENVPKANAGYLPTIEATGSVGIERAQACLEGSGGGSACGTSFVKPRSYGIQASETVFNGNRTLNSIRQAESQVFGAREQLRNTEQNTLLSALTAYMDVLEDTAILDLDRNNVDVLKEQLRETRDRFTVGEVTRTDVAQAEASLAQGQGTALSAEATLQGAVARYRQFIGDQPTRLAPVKPLMRPIPKTLPEAISISQVEHPAISGSLHGVDAAQLQVKIAEGALYPTIGLTASISNAIDANGIPGERLLSGQIMGNLTIPIYQGGAEYATTRQAKESLSQQEIQTDSLRNQVRQAVVASWGLVQAAVGVVRAARASVSANEVALTGVREEAKVGQRTTLDVLNAQQALLQARTTLVQAEHDQVVDSYQLLSSIGRLNIPTLGLAVAEYDPRVHFDQVKSKWIGLRTPSGQ
jgi:outer membrane protein